MAHHYSTFMQRGNEVKPLQNDLTIQTHESTTEPEPNGIYKVTRLVNLIACRSSFQITEEVQSMGSETSEGLKTEGKKRFLPLLTKSLILPAFLSVPNLCSLGWILILLVPNSRRMDDRCIDNTRSVRKRDLKVSL
jgi:hypothetical protein